MEPAHPPLPTARSLLFHPATGIHTSILISDCAVGREVAATRQNAGRVVYTLPPRPPRPPGAVNPPAATVWAVVISVCGSFKVIRLSQGAAAAQPANRSIASIGRTISLLCRPAS